MICVVREKTQEAFLKQTILVEVLGSISWRSVQRLGYLRGKIPV